MYVMDNNKQNHDSEGEKLLEAPPEEKLIEPPEEEKLIADHSVTHNSNSVLKIVIGLFIALVLIALAAIAYTTFNSETDTVLPESQIVDETNVIDDDFAPIPDDLPPATDEAVIDENQVFCTMDAKICPDGSSVGRMPPDCEFAACPGE